MVSENMEKENIAIKDNEQTANAIDSNSAKLIEESDLQLDATVTNSIIGRLFGASAMKLSSLVSSKSLATITNWFKNIAEHKSVVAIAIANSVAKIISFVPQIKDFILDSQKNILKDLVTKINEQIQKLSKDNPTSNIIKELQDRLEKLTKKIKEIDEKLAKSSVKNQQNSQQQNSDRQKKESVSKSSSTERTKPSTESNKSVNSEKNESKQETKHKNVQTKSTGEDLALLDKLKKVNVLSNDAMIQAKQIMSDISAYNNKPNEKTTSQDDPNKLLMEEAIFEEKEEAASKLYEQMHAEHIDKRTIDEIEEDVEEAIEEAIEEFEERFDLQKEEINSAIINDIESPEEIKINNDADIDNIENIIKDLQMNNIKLEADLKTKELNNISAQTTPSVASAKSEDKAMNTGRF